MSRVTDSLLLRGMAPRDRRAVLLGLAALLPALLWIAAIRPYRATLADVQERVAAERALLAREEALLAQSGTMPGAVAENVQRAERAALRLVRAPNVPLAEAELTAFLQEIATLTRVLLQDMRSVEPRRGQQENGAGSVRALRLSVRGESDLEGVLTFLQRIEHNPMLLRVSELSIEPQYEGNARGGDRMPTGVVQFTFVVEAYTPADVERPGDTPEVSQ